MTNETIPHITDRAVSIRTELADHQANLDELNAQVSRLQDQIDQLLGIIEQITVALKLLSDRTFPTLTTPEAS
jgi:prefoldin subunit 5